jgi:radical SAM protein with 4Fe4S-binding SPASM domain
MFKPIKINPRIGWRKLGDETVLFNCHTHEISILNGMASRVWEMTDKNESLSDIIGFISKEYHIREDRIKKDILSFFRELEAGDYISFEGVGKPISDGDQFLNNSSSEENVLLEIEMEAIKRLVPFSVTFETTYGCNEQCIHCSMEKGLPLMETSKIKETLVELFQGGCLFLSFTGGEFFTRRDFSEILEEAGRLHFAVDILSNGTLISEGIAGFLSNIPIRRVQVSLYGANLGTHDSVTRLSGSFNRTLEAITFLRNSGVKVEIAFPLMRINFHERYIAKKLADSLDCLFFPSHIITAKNDGSKYPTSLRLNDEELKSFLVDRKFFGLYGGRRPFQDHQFYLGIPDILDAAPCYSGFNSCAISPSGKVYPCNQFFYEVGDLSKECFSAIWNYSPGLKYLRSLTVRDIKKCSVCELLLNCSRCPGIALLEDGDLLGPSSENCRITRTSCELSK